MSKDDNNQVLRKKVVLKPPKSKDNPKIKRITRKKNSKKTEKKCKYNNRTIQKTTLKI